MLESLFLRVVTLSLTCSAVLLPLLLLFRRIQHRYAARTCYFLWLLLALRLVLPFQLTLPSPVVTVEAPVREVVVSRPVPMPVPTAPVVVHPAAVPSASVPAAAPAVSAPARTVTVTELLAVLWLAGAVGFGLWQAVSYALARRALLRRARPAEAEAMALLEGLKVELCSTRRVGLYRVDGVQTPMMLGLLRPVILLPDRAMSDQVLSVVLRHELTHLRRWDVAYKLVLLAADMVHWFNPLVWWMGREASCNLELCCDDDVVRGQDGEFRRLYGEILIETAARVGRVPALSTHFSGKGQLKERLRNLFKKKKNSAILVCVIVAATLLVGSLVVCQANGDQDFFDQFDQQMREEQALRREGLAALEGSIAYQDEALSFTIPADYAPKEGWKIHISGRAEADGMGMSLHYLDGEPWEAGKAYTLDIPPELWPDITELTMDIIWGELTQTVDLLAYYRQEIPDTGSYRMVVGPEVSALLAPGLSLDAGSRTFTFVSDLASSYLAQGTYTVSDGRLTAVTNDGLYHYVFRIVDGNTLAFVKEASSKVFTYTAPEVSDGALFVYEREVYQNAEYGFSLVLPKSWTGQWRAVEVSGDGSGDFYGSVAFYCTAVNQGQGGLLMELGVWPEERQELLGRERLLGHQDGCWVYLCYPQTDLPAQASGEAIKLYDTMYEDGVNLPGDALILPEETNLIYENGTWGFTLRLPDAWAEQGEITEMDNGEVRLKYTGLGSGAYGDIASLVILREPLQALTARIRLLGSQEGCYVYLSMSQTNWPEGADPARIEEYGALYDAIEALTAEDLAFFDNSEPGPEGNTAGDSPEAIAQKWLNERVSRFIEFDYNYTGSRIDSLEYAWTAGDYTAYRFLYSIRQDGMWIQDYEQTPYLILYQGSLHEVEFLADPADPGPYTEPMEAFRAVMAGQEGFLNPNTGETTMLADLTEDPVPVQTAYTAIKHFAVVDLDRDGVLEVVLEWRTQSAYIILRYQDGNVYGYEAYYRWFMPLRADSTIFFSGGAADHGCGTLSFAGGALLINQVTFCRSHNSWELMEYFVDGQPATSEEFLAEEDRQLAKPEAVWYDFTEDNIKAAVIN